MKVTGANGVPALSLVTQVTRAKHLLLFTTKSEMENTVKLFTTSQETDSVTRTIVLKTARVAGGPGVSVAHPVAQEHRPKPIVLVKM